MAFPCAMNFWNSFLTSHLQQLTIFIWELKFAGFFYCNTSFNILVFWLWLSCQADRNFANCHLETFQCYYFSMNKVSESSIQLWICFISQNCVYFTKKYSTRSRKYYLSFVLSDNISGTLKLLFVITYYFIFAMSFQEELLKKKSALKKTEVVTNDKKQEQLIVKDSEDYDRLIKETYFEA